MIRRLSIRWLSIAVLLLFFLHITFLLLFPMPSQAYSSEPGQGEQWNGFFPLSTPRLGFDACRVGNDFYVIGGINGSGNHITSIDIWNITTAQWSPHAIRGSWPVDGHRTVVVEDTIYVIGGENTTSMVDRTGIFSPSPSPGQWSEGPLLNHPRRDFSAAVVNGTIYIFGGRTTHEGTSRPVREIEMFNPNAPRIVDREWKVLNGTNPAFLAHSTSSVAIEEQIFLFGGITSEGETGDANTSSISVRVFDTIKYEQNQDVSMSWEDPWPDMPNTRHGMRALEHGGKIFLVGGTRKMVDNETVPVAATWCLDIETRQWQVLGDTWDIAREHFSSMVYDNVFYVIGGMDPIKESCSDEVFIHDFDPCDLVITSVEIPDAVVAGEEFTLRVSVRNIGGPSPASMVHLMLYVSGIGGENIDFALGSGNVTMVDVRYSIPRGGLYSFTLHLNPGNRIPEISKENNRYLGRIRILSPEVTIQDISLRVERNVGYRTIHVETMIRNTGSADATDITLHFYINKELVGTMKGLEMWKESTMTFTYSCDIYWYRDIADGDNWNVVLKDVIDRKDTTSERILNITVLVTTPESPGASYLTSDAHTGIEEVEMDVRPFIISLVLFPFLLLMLTRKVKKEIEMYRIKRLDEKSRITPILIIGTSQAGKTAYITMLDRELRLNKQETDWDYILEDGAQYIHRVRQWIDKGKHPPGTEKGIIENINMVIETPKKKFNLSVIDASGEDFNDLITPGKSAPDHLESSLRKSAAIIILVNPLKATENSFQYATFLEKKYSQGTIKKRSRKIVAMVFTMFDKHESLFGGNPPAEFVQTKMGDVYAILTKKYVNYSFFTCSAYGGVDQNGNPIFPPSPKNLTDPIRFILNKIG